MIIDYQFEELKWLGEKLGLDRPEVFNCLEKAARSPENIPIYKRHFLRLLKKEGYSLSDLPPFGRLIERDKHEGGILLGHVDGK
jgi:hypothetical protein